MRRTISFCAVAPYELLRKAKDWGSSMIAEESVCVTMNLLECHLYMSMDVSIAWSISTLTKCD